MDRDRKTMLRQIARMTSDIDCRVVRQPEQWIAADCNSSPQPFDERSTRGFIRDRETQKFAA